MQAISSIPFPAKAPRASIYWLLAAVALVAVAAVRWPAPPAVAESTIAPPPVVAAVPAATGDTSVPDASLVKFKDDGAEAPVPTF